MSSLSFSAPPNNASQMDLASMAAMATQLGVPTGTMGVPASAIVGGAIGGLGQQFNERW